MNKDDERPYYRVESQYSDGSADNTEEVYDLKNVDGEWKLTKREFGQMMLFLTSVMLIGGCAVNKAVNKMRLESKESGTYKESTLPCGSPIPPGAICKCNCIPVSSPRSYGTGSYGTYCSCNRVCTCNKVCTCIPVV